MKLARAEWIAHALTSLLIVACEARAPVARAPADHQPSLGGEQPRASPEPEPEHEPMLGVLVPEAEVVLVSVGFARLTRFELSVGDHVERGQLVAEMDLRGEQTELESARAAWHAAKAELERLELELARARDTRADVEQLEGFLSEAELREQRYAEKLAAARKRGAGAELQQQRSKMEEASTRIAEADLRAPFSGVVARRHVDVGATLSAGDPVVELISDARLLRFAVPERLSDELVLGAKIDVRFDEIGLTTTGEIISITPEIDAGTRLVFAEARLQPDPGERVRTGAVARVRFMATGSP